MMRVLLAVLIVFVILLVNEWWWRERTHGELSRKFVHLTVGTFVAFWPLFLTWHQIELLSLAFVIIVLLSQKYSVFKTIHSVQRPTFGEICFGLAVGVVALITHDGIIYAAALLHMSLADGLAAIFGVKWGASQAYRVLGTTKSVAGSLTFLVMSLMILTVYCVAQDIAFSPLLALLAVVATCLENVAVRGLDNILIPVVVALALTALK